ncbi:Integrase catalytic domain-containing protein [Abeliophyllum distichum]|uniref:Integrase catalytic domain-containing protein n=1 Tax=Abeliophyllum distichum TaxID=126358 RepID=A0ABD1RFX8_9LAMI
MESEFIALDKAGEESEWLRNFLEDIPCWTKPVPAISIHCDNQSAIAKPFLSGKARRARKPLELVHKDVCGTMRTPSNDHCSYFILFIDDYTRMVWVNFLRGRSKVFDIFNKFKVYVEKQSGHYIKTLRSERGKEYKNTTPNNSTSSVKMKAYNTNLQLATLEQNGVSERKNITMMETTRAMLLKSLEWIKIISKAYQGLQMHLLRSHSMGENEQTGGKERKRNLLRQ